MKESLSFQQNYYYKSVNAGKDTKQWNSRSIKLWESDINEEV